MPEIFPIGAYMDDRSNLLARLPGGAGLFHHLGIAHANQMAVNIGSHSPSGNFLNVFHRTAIIDVRIGIPQRNCDRMGRKAFDMSG